jgi:hypothetical protein
MSFGILGWPIPGGEHGPAPGQGAGRHRHGKLTCEQGGDAEQRQGEPEKVLHLGGLLGGPPVDETHC